MNGKNNDTFCPLAWIHSFVNLGGEYQVCCTSEEYKNSIHGENGKVYKITDDINIETVMNSQFMKNIRSQMMKGQWPEICQRCKLTEQMMGVSRREIESKTYESIKDDLLNLTSQDGSLNEIKILSTDYRLGNLCNLQCRMCNPGASKKWVKDWLEINPSSNLKKEDLKKYSDDNWFEKDSLIFDVEKKANSIEHLHFGGGEPLLSPRMRDILNVYIKNKRSKEIILTYNTNITVLPQQVLELWPNFKEVRLLVSVDAFGSLNDYIRPPSVWKDIDNNLKYLDAHAHELKVTQIMLNTTVQIYNILRLKELCEYLEQFKNIVKIPNFILLHYPTYLQCNLLSNELKKIALNQLNYIYKKNLFQTPENLKYLLENIIQIKHFLNIEPRPEAINKFKEVTKKLDTIHKMNLKDVSPELALLIEDS